MNNSEITQVCSDAYTSLMYLKVKSELNNRERLSHYSLFPNPDLEIPVELLQQSILEDMLDGLCDKLTDEQMEEIRKLAEKQMKKL